MLPNFRHEEVINELDKLQMPREVTLEQVDVPSHGELLHGALRLKNEAFLCYHESLLKRQPMLINQQSQQFQNTDRMMHIQQIQLHFLWQSLPVRRILLQKSPQNILKRGCREEMLLHYYELLDFQGLV